MIKQAAKADDGVFKADPTTLSYSSDGGTKTSTITSTSKGKTVGWSVMDKSSVPDWITLSEKVQEHYLLKLNQILKL